jgi:hypothetical protein
MLGFGAPKTAGKQPYNTQLETTIQALLRESGDPEYKQNPSLLYRDGGNKIGSNTASKIVELGFIYILNNSSQFKSYFPPNNTILTNGSAGPALKGYIGEITKALAFVRENAQSDTGGSGGSGLNGSANSNFDGTKIETEDDLARVVSGYMKLAGDTGPDDINTVKAHEMYKGMKDNLPYTKGDPATKTYLEEFQLLAFNETGHKTTNTGKYGDITTSVVKKLYDNSAL